MAFGKLGAMGRGFGTLGALGSTSIPRLDFSNGLSSAVWTFTRASAARERDAAGGMAILATDVPSTSVDPATGQYAGLALKGASSNAQKSSERIVAGAGNWSNARGDSVVGVAASPIGTPSLNAPTVATAPYGFAVAATDSPIASHFAEDTATGLHANFNTNILAADATWYNFSVFAKAGERTKIQLQLDQFTSLVGGGTACSARFDLSVGTIISTDANCTAYIEYAGDGYYRCSISCKTIVGGGAGRALIAGYTSSASYAGTLGSGWYHWGAMISTTETMPAYAGVVAASIPITRAADVCTLASGQFASRVGSGNFMIAIEVNVPAVAPAASDRVIWQVDDGTDNNRIALVVVAGSLAVKALVVVAGVGSYSSALATLTAGSVARIVVQRTGGTVSLYKTSATQVNFTPAGLPTPTTFRLGNNVALTSPLDGYILSVSPLPRALSDSQAQSQAIYTPRTVTRDGAALDFSVVLLPDIQSATSYGPTDWATLYNYVIAQKATLNIKACISVGDLTDDNLVSAHQAAQTGFDAMEAAGIPAIPYIGNHDYAAAMVGASRDATNYNSVWTRAWFATKAWFGDSYLSGTTESFWGTFTAASGRTMLVIALETFPRANRIAWAQSILDAHPGVETIILNHSYLYVDGSRVTTGMPNNAASYGFSDYDGQGVWDDLVKKNPQIFMVLSGHHIGPPYLSHRSDLGNAGNVVHQIYTNHQQDVNHGARATVLTFQPSVGKIQIKVYDPVAGAYVLTDERELRYR